MTFDRFLREACPGLDLEWRKYRRRSTKHRVDCRMRELGIEDYRAYLELVSSDPGEAAGLSDLMRVTVSRFFRELKEWWELKDVVLPRLLAATSGGELRAWSAGCCGGEEPYTLAILWLEYIQPLYPGCSIDIFATDIDEESLERARRALYREESLREVPPEIRSRRFSRGNDFWRLDSEAKGLVRFGIRNLMTDPPPAGQDLALCRYLPLTYYRGERLQAAVQRLREALRPGGILMVGRKETLPLPAMELFERCPGSAAFYQRKG